MLTLVINNFVPLPVTAITFLLKEALLIISFLLIGPEFGVKAVYTSVLMPGFMRAYKVAFRIFNPSRKIRFWMCCAIS